MKLIRRIILHICWRLGKVGAFHAWTDENYLKFKYRLYIGKKLNLDSPKSFNEKLQWLKLYDRKPQYTVMVDKYDAKDYVENVIGKEYIIPTLGVWDSFEEIDFDALPNQFVLKCTHDSGGVVICHDKRAFDKNKARKKINNSLKNNYYWMGREWPYKDVKPRIIAEDFISETEDDLNESDLNDYKLMCFNGTVKCSFICSERYSQNGLHVTFFDRDWNVMPFERHYPSVKEGLPKPQKYEEMVALAEKLSANIPFVRVDFYEVSGKIYFGELTLYPGSGFEEFTPEEWDYKLGSWLNLPYKE